MIHERQSIIFKRGDSGPKISKKILTASCSDPASVDPIDFFIKTPPHEHSRLSLIKFDRTHPKKDIMTMFDDHPCCSKNDKALCLHDCLIFRRASSAQLLFGRVCRMHRSFIIHQAHTYRLIMSTKFVDLSYSIKHTIIVCSREKIQYSRQFACY